MASLSIHVYLHLSIGQPYWGLGIGNWSLMVWDWGLGIGDWSLMVLDWGLGEAFALGFEYKTDKLGRECFTPTN